MQPNDSLSWLAPELDQLDSGGLRRRRAVRHGPQAAEVTLDGRRLVNFGSNDYLGLAGDPRLGAAMACAADGLGSGASPLLGGYCSLHEQLESRLAGFEGTEAALVFGSGFAANAGTIATLVGSGDIVLTDALNHASLFDGCRLSRADVRAFQHAEVTHLDDLLRRLSGRRRRLIVTDSLFSMDGDLAPLADLVAVADRHRAMLLVDEAHATGVFGARGRGVAEHLGVERGIPVRIGTLSKALGCMGGFVAGSRMLADWLVNRARPYIFSTAMPGALAAAAICAVGLAEDAAERRCALLQRAAWLRDRLREQSWDTGASASQIIPIIVGDAEKAVEISQRLRERGLFVPAIRPPTVPAGGSRLRVSVTAAHDESLCGRLLEALAAVR